MKKVYYALGAAAPVLGLVATAPAAHATQKGTKTVSLQHSGMAPDTTSCTHHGHSTSVSAPASHSLFNIATKVSGRCVLDTYGSIHLSGSPQPVHSLRTQVFSGQGRVVFSDRIHSGYSSGRVYFSNPVGVDGRKVCETLFKAKHPYQAIAGPVCYTV